LRQHNRCCQNRFNRSADTGFPFGPGGNPNEAERHDREDDERDDPADPSDESFDRSADSGEQRVAIVQVGQFVAEDRGHLILVIEQVEQTGVHDDHAVPAGSERERVSSLIVDDVQIGC
jgi:hypothetical protein